LFENIKEDEMKKLLVVLMVLTMATIANAGLLISVNGQIDPPDTEFTLLPSETVMLDVWGDGGTPPNTNVWLISTSLPLGEGAMAGGVLLYPGNTAFMQHFQGAGDPIIQWLQMMSNGQGYNTLDAYFISFGTTNVPPEALAGKLVDEILFHCESAHDVTLYLVGIDDDGAGTVVITGYDTQIIHQIPEPITVALLGLGGLFLRRRK
jgi:hypothetical protein